MQSRDNVTVGVGVVKKYKKVKWSTYRIVAAVLLGLVVLSTIAVILVLVLSKKSESNVNLTPVLTAPSNLPVTVTIG